MKYTLAFYLARIQWNCARLVCWIIGCTDGPFGVECFRCGIVREGER